MRKTLRTTTYIIVTLLAGAGLLLMAGCATHRPYMDSAVLREKILPPLTPAAPLPTTPAASLREKGAVLPSGPLTLQDAIAIALTNNHTLKISNEDAGIAEQQVYVARSLFLPQVTAGYGYDIRDREVVQGFGPQTIPIAEKEFQRAELKVQMTIWDFGRSLGNYQQAQLGREIADLTMQRVRQNIIYQVTQAYFNVLRAQKARDIAAEALEQARAHLKTATSLYENGVVDKNDVLRAEVHVAEVRQQLISAENALKLSISVLNNVLGINVNSPTMVKGVTEAPEFQMDLVSALRTAIDHRPEFKLVQKSIRMEKAGLKAARAEHFPRIYVAGTLSRLDDDYQVHKNSALGEVGIQIDLFSGGRTTAQIRVAERRIQKAAETARQVCDGIALEVKQALLGIEEARKRLAVAKKAVSQAEENLRLVENKYRQTAATPTDVVDAETLKTRAQMNYFTALYDYIVAVERLRYAMGTNEGQRQLGPINKVEDGNIGDAGSSKEVKRQ
ncbi:MAG: TolC family protein [Deltaproteobacteria bacterium]|nr:TolC family protein [Deltaproteobacteria bacterium]